MFDSEMLCRGYHFMVPHVPVSLAFLHLIFIVARHRRVKGDELRAIVCHYIYTIVSCNK
jgi:hypothetical protein